MENLNMNQNMGNGKTFKEGATDVLNTLPPKTAFFAGLLSGVLVVFTIGFFVLLGLMASDGSIDRFVRASDTDDQVAVASNNNANQPDLAPPPADLPPISNRDHVLGPGDAKVTIVEYSDLECPYCSRFHPTLTQLVTETGKVKWIYRHFPLPSHAGSQKKAEGAECAAELGGNEVFWKYLDLVFAKNPDISGLGALAGELGIDQASLESCINSGKYADYVQSQMAEGSRAGVSGTPASFVVSSDGEPKLVPGALPYESMLQLVESLLK